MALSKEIVDDLNRPTEEIIAELNEYYGQDRYIIENERPDGLCSLMVGNAPTGYEKFSLFWHTVLVKQALFNALMSLRLNSDGVDCWCDLAIGHPNAHEHSTACNDARGATQRFNYEKTNT